MSISAAKVKELRERTGLGMMDCKKALLEVEGDMEAAVELLRKAGLAKADKKADRVAADGLIVAEIAPDGKTGVVVEVNSETDFVAKKAEFRDFAAAVATRILETAPNNVDELLAGPLKTDDDTTVDLARKQLVSRIGENINVRRFHSIACEACRLASYVHGTRIGVIIGMENGTEELARDIAMHVAWSNPMCVSDDGVPSEVVEKEKGIFMAQAEGSGKPANIVEKMVEGRIKKFLAESTLLGQAFVKDPNTTVGKLLESAGARVTGFVRLELGEGIDKQSENFADEVMAQVRGSQG